MILGEAEKTESAKNYNQINLLSHNLIYLSEQLQLVRSLVLHF